MPRIALPTNLGQYTNTDEWASGHPGQIVNLLVDEHGTLTARPGLSNWVSPGGSTDQVQGLYPYQDRLIAVVKPANQLFRDIYVIDDDGNATDITPSGGLTGEQMPTFTLEGGPGAVAGRLFIFGGGIPLAITPGYRCSRFIDGSAPRATHGGMLIGRLITNDIDTGTVWYSDRFDRANFAVQSPNTSSAGGTFEANDHPDYVRAVASYQRALYLFGDSSLQEYYDTGGSSPHLAARDQSPPSSIGASHSLLTADQTLWWLDGERRVVRLEGGAPRVVSLPVEAQIRALSYVADGRFHHMQWQGHQLILCHFERAKLTLVYDYVRSLWSEWRLWSNATGDDGWTYMPLTAYAYHPTWDRHFCGGRPDGKVFEISSTTHEDDGNPRVLLWRGPYFDGGTNQQKLIRRMQLVFDGGVATTHLASGATNGANDTANPEIEVRWRNDDRQWQEPRQVSTGRIGEVNLVRDLWCRTTARKQQIELRYSAPTAFRISAIELDFEPRGR